MADEVAHAEAERLAKDGRLFRKIIPVRAIRLERAIDVPTHEGVMHAEADDYLVQNVRGDSKPWVVKKTIFEQSYEMMPDEDQ